MSFAQIIGHERPIAVLKRAILSERIAPAYLFVGPPNVGKSRVAHEFAKAVNCTGHGPSLFGDEAEGDPASACDQCDSCRRIDRDSHPDVHLVRPQAKVQAAGDEEAKDMVIEGAMITTEQIGDLISQANLKASQARRKIFIVCSAESMNPASANRLLKTLEEPPGDTTLVLTTQNLSRLLPTIISRCQSLTFRPAPLSQAEEGIRTLCPETDPVVLRSVVALSGGRIGWALRLLEHPQVLELRGKLLDLAASLAGRDWFEGMAVTEKLLEAAEDWWLATESDDFAEKALKASRDRILRTKTNEILDILLSWFRDLALLTAGGEQRLVVNADRLDQLAALAEGRQASKCRRACEDIEHSRRQLRGNANLRLAVEVLSFRLIGDLR